MTIKIHKEGRKPILIIVFILSLLNLSLYIFPAHSLVKSIFAAGSIIFTLFVLRFFRKPTRLVKGKKDMVYSSADGKIVAIEKTYEDEYFNDERIMVSVFMSVWDVHINWFPINSRVKYFKYHPGKYLVARHPKSSTLNERATTVVESEDGTQILIRQIAGYVARRVISYGNPDQEVHQGEEMGFIRFGSRVDIFLPKTAEIMVITGQKVKGVTTPLAMLKKV